MRDLIGEQQTVNISQATCRCVLMHRTFPRGGKSSKREWCALETLINNNWFVNEKLFMPFERTICDK